MRGLRVTGCERAAAAAATLKALVAPGEAVAVSLSGPGAPREVTRLLRASAALEYGRLQLAAVGERLGQAGQAAEEGVRRWVRWARAEGGQRPVWGAAELHMVLAAARRAELAQAVQAAERELAEAQRSCTAAYEAQVAIVGRLPALAALL